MDLFRLVVDNLNPTYYQWKYDLLEHIYEVMAQEKNPILEVENHPLCEFLEFKAEEDWESDSSDQ
jgi:hypothetical protein